MQRFLKIKYFSSQFTLLEILAVIVIMSLLMFIALPAFNDITKSHGINTATRNIAGKLILARSYAINNRKNVAVLMPLYNYPSTGIPSNYNNRSYRACIVEKNGNDYYFQHWIPGENWEFTPTGVAIFELDTDKGVNLTSGKLDPANSTISKVSPSPLPGTSPNKGIDFSSVGGNSSVTDCAAIIFKPSGKSTGLRYVEIGEGVYSSGSIGLIVTNPYEKSYSSIVINQFTGKVSYEKVE